MKRKVIAVLLTSAMALSMQPAEVADPATADLLTAEAMLRRRMTERKLRAKRYPVPAVRTL